MYLLIRIGLKLIYTVNGIICVCFTVTGDTKKPPLKCFTEQLIIHKPSYFSVTPYRRNLQKSLTSYSQHFVKATMTKRFYPYHIYNCANMYRVHICVYIYTCIYMLCKLMTIFMFNTCWLFPLRSISFKVSIHRPNGRQFAVSFHCDIVVQT